MDKWDYVRKISNLSNEYGDLLLDMMLTYDKPNLMEIDLDEYKEYYDNMIKRMDEMDIKPVQRGVVYGYLRSKGKWER